MLTKTHTNEGFGGVVIIDSSAGNVSAAVQRGVGRLRTREAFQASLNAVSTGFASLFSGIFTALAARHLASSSFGTLQFALSFLQFVALFFEFGISLPAARIAARSDADGRPEVTAATLTAVAPVLLGFSAVIFGLSFTVDSWSHAQAGQALRVTALISAGYPFQLISLQLCQGLDRLHVASLTNLLGQLAGIIGLVVVIVSGGHLTIESALMLRAGGLLVGSLTLIVWLRPRFSSVRPRVRTILSDTRSYGFAIYIGRLFSTATYNMDVLMIGTLSSARSVGLYTLADALARVMLLPIYGATAALFPRMVRDDHLRPLWIRLSWLTGAAGVIGLVLLGGYGIDLGFSSRYHDAVSFLVPLGAAEATRGVTIVYNSFLSAQARGRELRNAGIVLTASNLVLNLALIPPFGALGAAWASFAALIANLLAHIFYYRQSVARPLTADER